MTVQIIVDNKFVRIKGASRANIRKLKKVTSYVVAGHYFSPSFRAHRWDGKEHLLKFSRKHGYRVPAGLLMDILRELKRNKTKHEIIDKRRRQVKQFDFGWNDDFVLRGYQQQCVDAAMTQLKTSMRMPLIGRGMVVMPIRSGKTITAAAIVRELGALTVFVVPSRMLLHQTRDALDEVLDEPIGIIGDGHWDVKKITVATAQSLDRARGGWRKDKNKKKYKLPTDPRYTALVKKTEFAIFDECHHLKGDSWHKVMQDFDSIYKIGLSATVFLDNEHESERGVIWLKGCCGDILYSVSTTLLIDQGFLMRPEIRIYKVLEPEGIFEHKWCNILKNEAILENEYRNKKICDLAEHHVEQGRKVLIISNRLNQVDLLSELLHDAGVMYAVITGRTNTSKRKEIIEDYVEGLYDVLLGTVFGEGVDLPIVECVINAEGGKDVKATIQRMRNLTPNEGKVDAIYIDFADMMNPYFAKHSLDRLRTYRAEDGFNVRLRG